MGRQRSAGVGGRPVKATQLCSSVGLRGCSGELGVGGTVEGEAPSARTRPPVGSRPRTSHWLIHSFTPSPGPRAPSILRHRAGSRGRGGGQGRATCAPRKCHARGGRVYRPAAEGLGDVRGAANKGAGPPGGNSLCQGGLRRGWFTSFGKGCSSGPRPGGGADSCVPTWTPTPEDTGHSVPDEPFPEPPFPFQHRGETQHCPARCSQEGNRSARRPSSRWKAAEWAPSPESDARLRLFPGQ